MNMGSPACILVFSGKRKSGKDFVADILLERIGHGNCAVLRLSGPLKRQYAVEHGLDYDKLLDSSEYKEKYRADMIVWGEEKRDRDPGFFARVISTGPGSERPVWIISDARRVTDVQYFIQNYPDVVIKVRVQATEDVRIKRGWVFTKGVDDAESECGLDSGVNYDVIIDNDDDDEKLHASINRLVTWVKDKSLCKKKASVVRQNLYKSLCS